MSHVVSNSTSKPHINNNIYTHIFTSKYYTKVIILSIDGEGATTQTLALRDANCTRAYIREYIK